MVNCLNLEHNILEEDTLLIGEQGFLHERTVVFGNMNAMTISPSWTCKIIKLYLIIVRKVFISGVKSAALWWSQNSTSQQSTLLGIAYQK